MVKYEFRNDEPDIIYGRGYIDNLNYHIVWCTKYRNQALANPILSIHSRTRSFRSAVRMSIRSRLWK